MTTIKSYTDVEQSRKLAEILPLESADMKWYFWKSEIDAPKLPTFGYSKDAAENYKSTEAVYLPCWSLTALMNFIESLGKVEINFNCSSNKYWVNVHFESMGSFCQDHELYDSKIDALIAIIKKLKSRNLL